MKRIVSIFSALIEVGVVYNICLIQKLQFTFLRHVTAVALNAKGQRVPVAQRETISQRPDFHGLIFKYMSQVKRR